MCYNPLMENVLRDKDIREPLFEYLEENYGRIRIIEEKTMGRSRADVIMVTENALVGIEIKSDADTYARLARQVKDYDRFFDFNIAAVGASHGNHIEEHLPPHWGIITVDTDGGLPDFYTLRKMRPNPKEVLENKLSILWRPELAAILGSYGLPLYPGKSKAYVRKVLLDRIPSPELHRAISNALFERDYTSIDREIRAWKEERAPKRRRRRRSLI